MISLVTSAGRERRLLFGSQGERTLESILPPECTQLSEFEDALDITDKWISEGSYLYLHLLQIRTKQLQHNSDGQVEAGYLYLLNKWRVVEEKTATEFQEAMKSIEYTSQYRHETCVMMLGFIVNSFLKDHTGSVCAQYQQLPVTELGRNPVQCTPTPDTASVPTMKPTTMTTTVATSTSTTPTTVTTPTTTTFNNNTVCAICDDQSCQDNDTDVQHCSSSTDICVTTIVDTKVDRHFYRRCEPESYCRQYYNTNNGYIPFCFTVDGGHVPFDTNCTFCCDEDKCNIGPYLIPAKETLYSPN